VTKQAVVKAVKDMKIKVLFITPERLFMEDLSKFGRKISMVCVDEIHCASEWSHNFRPAYLVLHEMIKEKLGEETRVIGLTATATRAAQEQICSIFDIKYPEHIVTQTDLSRLNLQLSITRDSEKTTALLSLLRTPSFKKLTSILLFATQRRTTDQVAQLLNQNGFIAASYHAGKTDE
jgi:superfamily II DNA helicase RecQ